MSRLVVLSVALAIVAGLATAPALGSQHARTLTRITHPSPNTSDEFTGGVNQPHALAGTAGGKVLVGVKNDDVGGTSSGAAYLFNPLTGALETTFTNPTPAAFDQFGVAVAGSGANNVVIGAFTDDTHRTNAGAAYLFDTAGPNGNLLATMLSHRPSKNGRMNDSFGVSIASNGSVIAVGATHDLNNDSGAVFLYDSAGVKISGGIISNPTPQPNDHFGWSIAMNDNYMLVGSIDDDGDAGTGIADEGVAHLFDTSGTLLQTFKNPNAGSVGEFGYDVSLMDAPGKGSLAAGTYALVSDPQAAGTAGIVYVFDMSGNLVKSHVGPGADRFGKGVSGIDGTNLFIAGGPRQDSPKTDGGAVYLVDLKTGQIEHKYEMEDTSTAQMYLGNSVGVIHGADTAGGTAIDAIALGGSRWAGLDDTVDEAGAAWSYAIPEPGTLTAALALAGLTLARRRRRA